MSVTDILPAPRLRYQTVHDRMMVGSPLYLAQDGSMERIRVDALHWTYCFALGMKQAFVVAHSTPLRDAVCKNAVVTSNPCATISYYLVHPLAATGQIRVMDTPKMARRSNGKTVFRCKDCHKSGREGLSSASHDAKTKAPTLDRPATPCAYF